MFLDLQVRQSMKTYIFTVDCNLLYIIFRLRLSVFDLLLIMSLYVLLWMDVFLVERYLECF